MIIKLSKEKVIPPRLEQPTQSYTHFIFIIMPYIFPVLDDELPIKFCHDSN